MEELMNQLIAEAEREHEEFMQRHEEIMEECEKVINEMRSAR